MALFPFVNWFTEVEHEDPAPDEGHGFARLENLFDAYRKIVPFLDRELKPRPR